MKFNNLLKETQFHGGRRLAEKNSRWFWSISMLLLFGSSVTVVCVTIRRFLQNPTFMVHIEMLEQSMEFPSVMVCPEIFFREDKIDRFLSHVKLPQDLNATYLKSVMHMLAAFFSPDIVYKTPDLINIENLLKFNNMEVDTAGRLLTTSCRSTFIRCRWQSEILNCSSLFDMMLTGDGFCCVFNGRSLTENVSERQSKRKWYAETFGFGSGLTMVIDQSQAPLYDVNLSYKWLALQSSQCYVEPSINGTPLNPRSELWVKYSTQNFQIAEEARSLSHSLRKCSMAYEPLKFFPLYQKKYCIVECEVARTLKRCGCVRLIHPRPKGASYCDANRLLCAHHAMVSYDSDECNCLPACDDATDYARTDSFELHPGVEAIDAIYDDLNFSKITIVRVYVPSRKIQINSRWSYFNSIDLFSQLGGVFNVFFGCSILTLLELGILVLRSLRASVS